MHAVHITHIIIVATYIASYSTYKILIANDLKLISCSYVSLTTPLYGYIYNVCACVHVCVCVCVTKIYPWIYHAADIYIYIYIYMPACAKTLAIDNAINYIDQSHAVQV